MILITVRHATPTTCTPRDKQTPFSNRNKNKGKTTEPSQIWFHTSPSQWLITIEPRNWLLGFSISPLMSPLTTKTQNLKFESKTPWSTDRRPKSKEKLKRSPRRSKTTEANKKARKTAKSWKEQEEKLKTNTPPEINSP
jgi:hypothetical protein